MTAMFLGAASGALIGLGTALLLMVRFARPTLAERLADPPAPPPSPAPSGWVARLGVVGAPVLAALGLPTARTRAHLAVCERPPAAYLAEKTTTLLLGVAAPPLVAAVLLLAGANLPPLWAGIWGIFAAVCWLAPDLALRSQAEQRREELRHTVAAFADLVVIALAGGAGVSGALADASSSSTSWSMTRLRSALRAAAVRRDPPWVALRELSQRYGVGELEELAASLRLAGVDGARVRASLAAKAQTLRTQHLAAMDAQAQSATERMSLPVVTLFAGFLILIGFPALILIMTTL